MHMLPATKIPSSAPILRSIPRSPKQPSQPYHTTPSPLSLRILRSTALASLVQKRPSHNMQVSKTEIEERGIRYVRIRNRQKLRPH